MRHCRAALLAVCLLFVAPHSSKGLPRRRLQQQLTGPAPDLAGYRRAGCDNFTSDTWQPLRPAYHITVPYGWMNDPHGMFQLNGTTHVFVQYNPKAIQWGAPFWGHVVSRDLAHWTWLPPALLPDTSYDFNGVWSGAATVPEESGVPVLTYTAAGSHVPELGIAFQSQALAVPEDMSGADPLLKRWKKPDTNPFLVQVPPGGTNMQFRDPTEARHAVWLALTSPQAPNPLPASSYALAIGVQAHCLGGAGIYTAPAMTGPWSYVGNLYNQLNIEPQVNGQCTAARTAAANSSSWPGPAYGGPCDQFGAFCRMWEVVDFLELEPGLRMIKWDDQSSFRGLLSMEWYVLGNGPWDYSALNPPNEAQNSVTTSVSNTVNNNSSTAGGGSSSTTGSTGSTSAVFGQQYSGYPNATSPQAGSEQQQQQQQQQWDNSFNYVQFSDDASLGSLFRGELDGQRFAPMRTDYGSVYASMVFRTADGRQVLLGWIYDTAAGCQGSCSDQLPPVIERMGFKSAQTLPRALQYESSTKTLRAYPVNETSLLRGELVYDESSVPLTPLPNLTTLVPEGVVDVNTTSSSSSSNSSSSSSSITSPAGNTSATTAGSSSSSSSAAAQPTARQFEVQLNFTLLPPGQQQQQQQQGATDSGSSTAATGSIATAPTDFAVGLRILTGSGTYTDVYLQGSLAFQSSGSTTSSSSSSTGTAESNNMSNNMSYDITSLSVWVDRSQAGGGTNTSFMEGGPVPLPVNNSGNNSGSNTWQVPQDKLGLSVWVDHSVVEVYALGGLARVTSRIYPEGDDVAWGLAAWAVAPSIGAARGAGSTGRTSTGWGVLLDGRVWNVENAWLQPSC